MKQWSNSSNRTRHSAVALVAVLAALYISSLPDAYGQSAVSFVNAASLRAEQPLSAGSWVLASGNFGSVTPMAATSFPLPQSLGGVTVSVDGVQAAIGAVSPTELRFLVPYQTAPGLRGAVVVSPGGTFSSGIRIINAAPGIFTVGTNIPPQGMILNPDGSNNSQVRPANRGQLIVINATGHGALAQQVLDGAAAPANPPAATLVNPQVFLGGVECTVESSALAPGLAGLWQIKAKVPDLSFLAGQLPVQVFMNGVDSNEVTIYVAP